ncbi:sigma factor-like helix-turn-helix DNA-binding protein [Sorangium sp. So ce176]|uniref:sigma factor-like helix-turn-helix DNA-binding protein n=1 Tax=Sorangium sp. So ce176 TaxID=3133286 RepID=UPI003F5E5149
MDQPRPAPRSGRGPSAASSPAATSRAPSPPASISAAPISPRPSSAPSICAHEPRRRPPLRRYLRSPPPRRLFRRGLPPRRRRPAQRTHRRIPPSQVRSLFESLTPREREVLRLRFGLDGEQTHTPAEIGGMFSVSRERVRQIEENALSEIRTLPRRHALEVPLEG